ncbi:MFS transporter [Acetobacter ghanensis]|uniref:MFS transporter n=1 Tax=Acetobacter ghanensis TaxID=431306 RepID=A0A0U5BGQ9_9PROT|nr:MFS transporter [Acetobacter ghanensis]NHO40076.1 MFS transporter [Acetobacter ghanensis]GBQ45609.1 major facilitator superfamily transporter [Acetobacter ghanensis DSM 18895]CEF54220.1 major facilitator superfamily transporter [Acetobacter ghanensis]
MVTAQASAASPLRKVLSVVLFNLLVYIVIGMPNAVLTIFVHTTLGYSTTLAGLTFALQYAATFATRSSAGRLVDKIGPKPVVIGGLLACICSGLLIGWAGALHNLPSASLGILLISRLFLGWAESWTATGVIIWNIHRAGAENTALAISWNGICSYGGIALGAPIGATLALLPPPYGGLVAVGALSAFLPVFGLALIGFYQGAQPHQSTENPIPFRKALHLVLWHGSALAAGSIGFAAISSFLALYYAAHHWAGAATALAVFGIVFVCIRFFFAGQIKRRGGVFVAIVSLLVEAVGLTIIGLFPTHYNALLGAALTGAGFSLLFPALGVLAVNKAGPYNRGAALSAYSIFLDLAIAGSGVTLGPIIEFSGYSAMFLTSAACCLAGAAISYRLKRSPHQS